MDIYVFEDSEVLSLGPLVAARPACDITIGTSTLYAVSYTHLRAHET